MMKHGKNRHCLSRAGFAAAAMAVFFAAALGATRGAQAYYCSGDLPNDVQTPIIVDQVNAHTTKEFQKHQNWMVDEYFKQYILPAMQLMAEHLATVGMYQMQIVGTLLDAKHQMETERLFQQLAAQAHKDYHISDDMCTFGTNMRSLATSDMKAGMTAIALSQYSIDRQLQNANSGSSEGILKDKESRRTQFKEIFCNPNDNNRGLTSVCKSTDLARRNKDIDFARTLWEPLTIEVDFSDNASTPDEQDLLALQKNLYAHDIFNKVDTTMLEKKTNQQKYLDMRSIVAKRSVAENTFEAIAGMKASGASDGAETAKYMAAVLRELGIPAAEAARMVGRNPSYYAQMEILTKTVLQRPQFFVDLYDKPANVTRKALTLSTLDLMQERDAFKSGMRSEAILSLILELQVMKTQQALQNEQSRMQP